MKKMLWAILWPFAVYSAVVLSLWCVWAFIDGSWKVPLIYPTRGVREILVTVSQACTVSMLFFTARSRLWALRRSVKALKESRLQRFNIMIGDDEMPEVLFIRKPVSKHTTLLTVASGPPLTKKLLDEMEFVIRELQKQKANES